MEFTRSWTLDDLTIRSAGDGRTVEAYATVFNTPAEVRDADGEYMEEIDPTAFNMALGLARSKRGGWNIPVIFNHGMTLFQTPSEQDSGPIGVVEEIKPDKHGLFTRAKYHNTQRGNEVLEMIRDGSITAYSFSGSFRKSNPAVPRGGFRRRSDGSLPTVRRMESTLREFGPVTFPVYAGAEILGVRAEQVAMYLSRLAPEEIDRLANILTSRSQTDQQEEHGSFDEEPATEEQSEGHSVRSPREIILARYAEHLRTRSNP